MTDQELTAFAPGIRHAGDMALASALMLEIRDDAREVRQRAAIEALRGVADGLKATLPADGKSEMVSDFSDPKGTHETRTLETAGVDVGAPVSLSDQRHAAIAAGYSGDACTSCGNFTLRRAGTCLSCDTCGSTTGCS